MRAELTIDDLAPGGEGVGRCGARTVFVPYAAPGDRVVAEVPPGDGTAHGALVALLAPGAARAEPPCVHFGTGTMMPAPPGPPPARDRHPPRSGAPQGGPAGGPGQAHPPAPALASSSQCGGCEWQHVRYEAQLAAKERTVVEALRRIARLAPGSYPLAPIVASPAPLRYRARAKLHLDRESRRLVFFRRRSHAPVAIEACHLLEPGLEALRAALGPALVAARLSPREVAIEWSALEARGSALLALDPAPAARDRGSALLREVPALSGLVLRGGEGPASLVGAPVLRLARDPSDPAAGAQRSRPDVFQQANRGANARLVRAALDLLRPDGADVLELYCGAGNFTGPLAARARSVAAVEGQGPALELAREDLGAAGNVRFFAGDALRIASALAAERGSSARRFEAVLLDPPREGAKGLGKVLSALGAGRAVYVSCDPATLARDVRGCVEAGFRVAAVQPVDMFPQTHHVEAVVALERA